MDKRIFNLLDRRNQAVLNIIEIISDTNQWYSMNELSLCLNVSDRTVQRYVQQLKEFVDDYNLQTDHKIELLVEKFKGIKLIIDRGSSYMIFRNYILEKDDTLLLLSDLLLGRVSSARKYADDHFVNEDTVRKQIRKIREFLNVYDVSIANQSLDLTGEEKQIRLVTFVTFWLVFKGVNWPFKTIEQYKINQTIEQLEDDLQMNLSEINRRQISYMMAVVSIRAHKGHIIEIDPEWNNYLNIKELLGKISFLKAIREEHHIFQDSEIAFLALALLAKPKFYESSAIRQRIFDYQEKTQSDVYLVTQTFVTQFEKMISPIPENIKTRFFYTCFCTHLFAKIFQNIHVDIDGHDIYHDYDDDYPILQLKIESLIDVLANQTKSTIFAEKNYLTQKYMLLFSSILPLTYFEPTISLFLDSDLPFFLKNTMTEKLTGYFKFDFNLKVLENNEDESADLILTNIPNLFEEEHRFSYSIHLFDYPFKPRDFSDIEKKLKIIIQRKMEKIANN
ncbi:helix-turn-helix domain-containing protein [Vagococcus sp.]|uniref:helix-turn-helix domain-containing protein n=1 Tax=Vagococcus sp. TaxID=1933889 RepID=UPI003F9CC205